jgi:hypothetical protein
MPMRAGVVHYCYESRADDGPIREIYVGLMIWMGRGGLVTAEERWGWSWWGLQICV